MEFPYSLLKGFCRLDDDSGKGFGFFRGFRYLVFDHETRGFFYGVNYVVQTFTKQRNVLSVQWRDKG